MRRARRLGVVATRRRCCAACRRSTRCSRWRLCPPAPVARCAADFRVETRASVPQGRAHRRLAARSPPSRQRCSSAVRQRPQRLLDVQRRARRRPAPRTASARRVSRCGRVPRRELAEQDRQRRRPRRRRRGRPPAAPARRPSAPARSPSALARMPSGPSTDSRVERPHRHAGVDQRDQQHVLEQAARAGSRRAASARARPPRSACARRRGRGRCGGRRPGRRPGPARGARRPPRAPRKRLDSSRSRARCPRGESPVSGLGARHLHLGDEQAQPGQLLLDLARAPAGVGSTALLGGRRARRLGAHAPRPLQPRAREAATSALHARAQRRPRRAAQQRRGSARRRRDRRRSPAGSWPPCTARPARRRGRCRPAASARVSAPAGAAPARSALDRDRGEAHARERRQRAPAGRSGSPGRSPRRRTARARPARCS